ncbi:similar to Saccharomyces cerevisiae YPL243W SRP68 Core component of the signal recognition particle (SRP) ribonucleoprotein (RNP) complex [Maudiozyma saulgeensis]|uniref:Signal recognition particle subunit SRP68 n=1 Tax=Maudiozyma saulgeensis TaxID=1789683 RepID=A0A1X7R7G2_9SACH|nr:similar to Saccharomyces cerevisiae YPL243W SRP68 Core component of the signal recognition particle (SRP) ribonucleoprotein (RNP) complex [Kazachstania saulgeensis]
MVVYSPIAATYGSRIEQFVETESDFCKYHDKLNVKLRHLRHRCKIITKDTRKYSTKEKYSKITSDDYDKKNKLFGALVLMHSERDLSFAEAIKLRIRQRGKAKGSEQKLLGTRLKKAYKTSQNLLEITKNEGQWITRAQYLAYAKIVHAEYLIFGKKVKTKNNTLITKELALALAACTFLKDKEILPTEIIDYLNTKYEYTLTQYGDRITSSIDLNNFVSKTVEAGKDNNDELAELLFKNGYITKVEDVEMEKSPINNKIEWRAFNCKIKDNQIAQLINDVSAVQVKDIADYSSKLSKWENILSKQHENMARQVNEELDADEDENMDNEENEEILLAYIKFQTIFTSISRDASLFNKLWKQWEKLGSSMSSKLTKYKEIERIVKNLKSYLKEVTELPGIYSDDELIFQLELSMDYFQLYLNAGCLASLYQSKGKYRESLALYVHSHQTLQEKLQVQQNTELIKLPEDLLTEQALTKLNNLIKTGWNSVVALAEYEKELNTSYIVKKYQPTVVEKIDSLSVRPSDVHLNNLFPLRPIVKPVGAKPTLFDLAFNYIEYEEDIQTKANNNETAEKKSISVDQSTPEDQPAKKRGFLGLFGR